MSFLETLGTTLGVGFLSGIRLYMTVLLLGLAARFGWIPPGGPWGDLQVLADTRVLTGAGILCALEFVADKVAWFDSIWDAVHTFIRPIGGALLALTASQNLPPAERVLLTLLAGGVAFAGHSSKAATRLAVNHSPEPFSNIAMSVAGDLAVPAGIWFVTQYPLVALGILTVFVAVFAWLAPKVFRSMRVYLTALASLLRRCFGLAQPAVPGQYLEQARAASGAAGAVTAIRCVAPRTYKPLRNTVGYLCRFDDQAATLWFVGRRGFGWRTWAVTPAGPPVVRRGLLVDHLAVPHAEGEYLFRVFKDGAGGVFPVRSCAAAGAA